MGRAGEVGTNKAGICSTGLAVLRRDGFASMDAGDKVLMLARQVGSTETGGVPVESLGAAVMTFEDGRVTRIEFHLDRDRAMKVAGLAD